MITREDVKKYNMLPEEVLDCIPENCECGGNIVFTDTVRQVYCDNEYCYHKIATRLANMAYAMGCDGWGEKTCETVCRYYKLKSPYSVFSLQEHVHNGQICPGVSVLREKVDNICDMNKRKVELWEMVKYAGIPSIDTTAHKIFGDYTSIEDAYADIEKKQVPFIAQKLGLKKSDESVTAVDIYNKLIKYKNELLYGEQKFEIIVPSGIEINIAITGGVTGFKSKSEFIKYIKERYNGLVNPVLATSVSSSIDILVADGDTSSNKYKKATAINDKYLDKLIELGQVSMDNIGKLLNEKDLHRIGKKILIGESEYIIEELDRCFKS